MIVTTFELTNIYSAFVAARSEFIIANRVEIENVQFSFIGSITISALVIYDAIIVLCIYQDSFISWSRVPTRKIQKEKVLLLSKYTCKCANHMLML